MFLRIAGPMFLILALLIFAAPNILAQTTNPIFTTELHAKPDVQNLVTNIGTFVMLVTPEGIPTRMAVLTQLFDYHQMR